MVSTVELLDYSEKQGKAKQKFILKQPLPQRQRILSAISKLPEEGDRKALQGHPGYYRLRVGEYRIIYTIENDYLIVRITRAGNRGDIYKNL